MDSPGNDLEGIAGQVGAGCNLFLFATGNGSITNFPFVPTLKITTTTRRHQLLVHEMDINAGRYLDGEPMQVLAAEAFDLVIATASGQRSRGEHAGHSQASLWRNWRQSDTSHIAEIRSRPQPDGSPLIVSPGRELGGTEACSLTAFPAGDRFATERLGLVLPTSMCSAQIARLAAERMNARGLAPALGFTRFLALAHSEGCGFGGESMYHLLHRTYRGYATHPNVAAALLLEHGCEKIPNDAMRRQFEAAGLPLDRFGWASVQLDGGIDKALANVETWFKRAGASLPPAPRLPVGLGALSLGLLSAGPAKAAGPGALARVARTVLAAGGSVLLPEGDPLLAAVEFRSQLLGSSSPRATLAYGQPFTTPGLHLVQTDSDHWVENLSGLGACGVHAFLGLVGDSSQQGHPMLPVLQVAERAVLPAAAAQDVDVILNGDLMVDEAVLLRVLADTVQGDYTPVATAGGFVDFQLSRGLLGVST
jgi:altronate dehydratase